MAYDKFKANVMAKAIQKERDRATVLIGDCNREYEGDVKKLGDSVTIKGAGKITMHTYSDGTQASFSDPETIEGTNAIMTIKHISQFNFMVSDVDREQGADGALAIYQEIAGKQIANEQDKLIASLADDALAQQSNATTVTAQNILAEIDKGIQKLWEADVPQNERLVLNVSPRFYMLMKQNYVALDTDNSEMLKRGAVAMYGNVDIKLTNNIATKSSGAQDLIMLRTNKAIAFANPLTKLEAKRANNFMGDEIRGISLYDAKIIKPKEMYVLVAKYS